MAIGHNHFLSAVCTNNDSILHTFRDIRPTTFKVFETCLSSSAVLHLLFDGIHNPRGSTIRT